MTGIMNMEFAQIAGAAAMNLKPVHRVAVKEVIMKINIDKLKDAIIDYYGTAMFNNMDTALLDLSECETLSDEKIIELATSLGINVSKYILYEF